MDATPAAAAKGTAHGFKGVAAFMKKKPALTFAIVGGIGIAAYMIRKRQSAANANADAAVPELDYSGANAPIGSITDPNNGGGGGYYPDPTQGVGDPGTYIPGGTSGYVPMPPDSWGPPWWWTNPSAVATGGGLPNGTPGAANTQDAGQAEPPLSGLAYPVYAQPAPLPAVASPHVVSSTPQKTTGPATPSWAGPGHEYPFSSDRGWYKVVLVASGPHKGRWHYYGPNDNPKIKV